MSTASRPGRDRPSASLPAENATGNYIKITQRVPVKIVFDGHPSDLQRLAPGMSVEPKVGVR